VGVLLTSLYTFRVIFLVFFGEAHSEVTKRPGYAMLIPCFLLAFLSIIGGYLKTPFGRFVGTVLPWTEGARVAPVTDFESEVISGLVFLLGLYLAYIFFLRKKSYATALASSAAGDVLHRFWFSDWGMDWLYDGLFLRPLVWFARVDKNDFIDRFYTGVAWLNEFAWRVLRRTETGRLRWYAAGIAAGSVVFIAVVLFL
jgi:NADH-quinone oxidoreductase subunit L